ncbi:MAG: CehA/McbA family metallohydrolase [Methanosarcinaceae archaeon]|nr:CehA/McbA family metallohydrolase [Methanosarcinaceae archaeon]
MSSANSIEETNSIEESLNGTITLKFVGFGDNLVQSSAGSEISEFFPVHIRIVDFDNEEVCWEKTIEESEAFDVSIEPDRYKVYAKYSNKKSTIEYDNRGIGYDVKAGKEIVLYVNTQNKDVFSDASWRVSPGEKDISILLCIVDANYFDYDLDSVKVYLDIDRDGAENDADDRLLLEKQYDITVENKLYNLYEYGDWYDLISLPISGTDRNGNPYNLKDINGKVYLHIKFEENGGLFDPDGDAHDNLRIELSDYFLPSIRNWHAGDTHYHSSYTDSLVESGAPIEATALAGKEIGLSWVTITDHSFDLDSDPSGSDSRNEAEKWIYLTRECREYSNPEFLCIPGEEISVVSEEGKYIHLLAYNISSPIKGEGVNGDPFGGNEKNTDTDGDGIDDRAVTFNAAEVMENIRDLEGISYAAHPFDCANSILNRGFWTPADIENSALTGLEIWNEADNMAELETGLEVWKNLLLSGRNIFILAGNDAHGDFNHKEALGETSWENAFGKVRTYIYSTPFSKEGVLEALRNGNSILTEGPVLVFEVEGKGIGTTLNISENKELTINITGVSCPALGEEISYTLYYGPTGGTERVLFSDSFDAYPQNCQLKTLNLTASGYLRAEAYSSGNDRVYRAYTNPIWISKSVSATLTVDDGPGADYVSIQDAVDNANPGDTIMVYPGIYVENVNLNKNLTLVSFSGIPDNTIVKAADPKTHVFHVRADRVLIRGFKVEGGLIGIYLNNTHECNISNNVLLNNTHGIWLESSSNNELSGNTVNRNSLHGMYMHDSAYNIISNNCFNNTDNTYFEGPCPGNLWNTTKIAGNNIIGGPYLGGNFWVTPDGTGFSQTHNDSDGDGICEEVYEPGGGNVDNLPLIMPRFVDWNPWSELASPGGVAIKTAELQEAVYCWLNNESVPGTAAEISTERLQEVISLWLES